MKGQPAKSRSALTVVDKVSTRIRGHLVGELLSVSAGRALVTFPGNMHGPVEARSVVDLPHSVDSVPVLLVFEHERSDLPIITGVFRANGLQGEERSKLAEERPADAGPLGEVVAKVDGKRVVIELKDCPLLRLWGSLDDSWAPIATTDGAVAAT